MCRTYSLRFYIQRLKLKRVYPPLIVLPCAMLDILDLIYSAVNILNDKVVLASRVAL